MPDPTRSRTKGHGRSSAGGGNSGPLSSTPLVIWTSPPDGQPCLIDLTEFATGRILPMGEKERKWGGNFTGRPRLIAELAPAIRARYALSERGRVNNLTSALRSFWRHLDIIEAIAPCQSLADLNEAIAAQWIRAGVPLGYYKIIRSVVYAAREALEMSIQVWPRTPKKQEVQSDAPSDSATRALYHELKQVVHKLVSNWAECDARETRGSDPRLGPRRANGVLLRHAYDDPADRIVLFKKLMAEWDTPLPDKAAVPGSLRQRKGTAPLVPGAPPASCTGIAGQLRWFYPSVEDIIVFLLLFLLLTGWNPQVAFDLDVSTDDWYEPHPLRDDLVMIHSVKERAGGTIQTAISMTKPALYPYRLICALIKQTAPLRAELLRRLAKAETALAQAPEDPELKKEVARLREGVRSPWLYFNRDKLGDIRWLRNGNSRDFGRVLNAVIELANERIKSRHANLRIEGKVKGKPELIPKIIPSDFRDAWIGYAYAMSGYNWLIAKLAAGHKTVNQLRDYLRHLRWRTHSEQQYRRFMDALWSEIGERKVVDGAILRWLVTHGEITDEQRKRWEAHKDRTRMGTGCKDFHHPPNNIAPDHVEGRGCRVQRCTLCPHAVVFEDSLDGIARRLAELEHIKATIPLTAWFESSFPVEVEATESTLTLFDSEKVRVATDKWRSEIASGRHYVFQFEGSYQEADNG